MERKKIANVKRKITRAETEQLFKQLSAGDDDDDLPSLSFVVAADSIDDDDDEDDVPQLDHHDDV